MFARQRFAIARHGRVFDRAERKPVTCIGEQRRPDLEPIRGGLSWRVVELSSVVDSAPGSTGLLYTLRIVWSLWFSRDRNTQLATARADDPRRRADRCARRAPAVLLHERRRADASGIAATDCGGGGIRTHGKGVAPTTVFETARFSHSRTPPRRAGAATRIASRATSPRATRASGARAHREERSPRIARVSFVSIARGPRARHAYRRELKKSISSAAHSGASRPPATSGRWFRRGSARMFRTEPAAPAFGSVVP